MKNIEKLFTKNSKKRLSVTYKKNGFHYISDTKVFDSGVLLSIIDYVNAVRKKYPKIKPPIYFEFVHPDIQIQDKLAFIVFECICYSLKKEKRRAYIFWQPKKNIITQGVYSSPLKLLKEHNDKYIGKFQTELYLDHFRKMIVFNRERDLKSNYLGKFQQEMEIFLRMFNLSEDRIDKISEMIVELVGNAGEHGNSDCLVDIDIADDYAKKGVEGTFYGINIAIISFSDKLLGQGVQAKIKENEFNEGRYLELSKAYQNHLKFIQGSPTGSYNEEYFWNIAALQDKISGRKDSNVSGGTGLSVLIKSLQEEAENATCYMLSGNKILFFNDEFLNYDENNWLGFNKEKDFFNFQPNEEILAESNVYIQGTAFNLSFAMRKEEKNEN